MLEISVIRNNKKVFDSNSMVEHTKRLFLLESELDRRVTIIRGAGLKPDKNLIENGIYNFKQLMAKDDAVAHLFRFAMTTGITVGANVLIGNPVPCFAGDLSVLGPKIKSITNPIIELLASLGYPMTYGMLIVGMIMIITGRKKKGLEIIKWAAIGYIGLQFVPFLLNLLDMIGAELRNSI